MAGLPLASCRGPAAPTDISAGQGGQGAGGTAGVHHDPLACAQPELGEPALRLLGRAEVERTLRDVFPALGGQWVNALPANTVSAHGFDNDASATAGRQWVAGLLATAESLAAALTGPALHQVLPCAQRADDACAAEFIDRYGSRLFRRPLTEAERGRYLEFFASARAQADFQTALRWLTVGLVQSPHAVYRSELGLASEAGTRMLAPFELATALSYTFSGTTPSPELLEAASAGALSSSAERIALAERLLRSDRGQEVVRDFLRQYLGYTRSAAIERPMVRDFAAIAPALSAEADAFVDAEILRGGGGVRALLTAARTYPSRALAQYYGFAIPASDGDPIERPSGRGVGALAQGGFLAAHAASDASSPTRRGLFVHLRLLCQPHLEVPADVPQLGAAEPGRRTTRQRYEAQHIQAGRSCAGCHRLFDPLGFAFEHFDEGGRYRDDEGGLPVDSAAAIEHPVTGATLSFSGQQELMALLADDPAVHACIAHHLAVFAFGTHTACLAAGLDHALDRDDLGLVEAIARLAGVPHFSHRRAR